MGGNRQVQELTSKVDNTTMRIEAVDTRLEAAESCLKEINSRLDTITTMVRENEAILGHVKENIAKLEATTEALHSLLDKTNKEVQSRIEKIEALTNSLSKKLTPPRPPSPPPKRASCFFA